MLILLCDLFLLAVDMSSRSALQAVIDSQKEQISKYQSKLRGKGNHANYSCKNDRA